MLDPESIRRAVEVGRVNLNGAPINYESLELILIILGSKGRVVVENCGGSMSLLDLGAQLAVDWILKNGKVQRTND